MDAIDWSKLRVRTRGRLPHWEIPGMTAFLTFRLDDSLPAHVVDAYRLERRRLDQLAARNPNDKEVQKERTRLFCERIDRYLDNHSGSCALREPEIGHLVLNALLHFDHERYLLHTAVVMPNHVHLVATLSPGWDLETITHSWKSFTAHEAINKHGRQRPFWQSESYDHIVRDETEFERINRYVLANPGKAGLCDWPVVYERPE